MLSVGTGCAIVASCLEHRRRMHLRIALTLVLAFGWMVLTNWYGATYHVSFATMGLIRYTALFLLFALSLNFWAKANFCQSLYAVTVAYSIQNLCERLIEIPRYSLAVFPVLLDRFCLALLMAVSLWVFAHVLIGRSRQRSMFNFDNLNSRLMLFMAFAVVVISIGLDIEMRRYADESNIALANCLNEMAAVFSFMTIVICMSHLRETDSEHRAEIAEYLLQSERARYDQEKQIHDAINIKCHDIRHQIAALGETGYREELSRISSLVDIYDTAPHTQNSALDVVLGNKMLACVSQGITLTCLADGRRMDFMESSDIYALFGNILDNAIDATRCIQEPERRLISLSVGTTGDLLMIESRNFYVNAIAFSDGLPQTSKEDKDYHGYGVRSIRMITEKYGGDLQFRTDDGIFWLSIMFPIPS